MSPVSLATTHLLVRCTVTDRRDLWADALMGRLGECVERDAEGHPQLTVTLPDENSLRGLASTLAKLLDQER